MSPPRAGLLAWTAFTVGAVCWAASGLFLVLTRSLNAQTNWGASFLFNLLFGTMLLAFPVAGVLLATRRPANPIGWLLLAIGVWWGLAGLTSYADYGIRLHRVPAPGAATAAIVGSAMWVPAIGLTGTFLILLFPDGHLPGPRWRWVAGLSAFGIVAGTLSLILTPGVMSGNGYPRTVNPLGVDALASVVAAGKLTILLLPLTMVASAVSLVVRYRSSDAADRLQIKWLAAAAAVVAVIYLIAMPVSLAFSPASGPGPLWVSAIEDAALLSFGLIPVAIGVAVLRYRLYEIDVIIRRTLVYAALVAALALVYLGGITLIGWALRSATGQSGALAVTISTLGVVVAFRPMSTRIQRAVDRRFYRSRYDAARALRSFSTNLRRQTDLDEIERNVLAAVRGTVQPAHVSVWLRAGGERAGP